MARFKVGDWVQFKDGKTPGGRTDQRDFKVFGISVGGKYILRPHGTDTRYGVAQYATDDDLTAANSLPVSQNAVVRNAVMAKNAEMQKAFEK